MGESKARSSVVMAVYSEGVSFSVSSKALPPISVIIIACSFFYIYRRAQLMPELPEFVIL